MCCNHKVHRFVVFFSSLVTQVAGGIVVWGGEELRKFAMMRSFEKYHSDLVGLAVIACGGLMGIVGLLGLCGAKWRLTWCIGLFCSCTLWIGLMLAAAGAGAFYFQGYLDDHLTRNSCRTVELLQDGDDAMQVGATLMCTYLCPCDYDPQLLIAASSYDRHLVKGSAVELNDCKPCEGLNNLSPTETNEINSYLATFDMNLATCQSMTNSEFKDAMFSGRERQLYPLLGWLERSFSCAGLCSATWIYSFSDINNAVPDLPTEPCFKGFVEWVDDKAPIFGGIGVGVGGLMLIFTFFAGSLCCLQLLHKS